MGDAPPPTLTSARTSGHFVTPTSLAPRRNSRRFALQKMRPGRSRAPGRAHIFATPSYVYPGSSGFTYRHASKHILSNAPKNPPDGRKAHRLVTYTLFGESDAHRAKSTAEFIVSPGDVADTSGRFNRQLSTTTSRLGLPSAEIRNATTGSAPLDGKKSDISEISVVFGERSAIACVSLGPGGISDASRLSLFHIWVFCMRSSPSWLIPRSITADGFC